jgi:hypothetical protein
MIRAILPILLYTFGLFGGVSLGCFLLLSGYPEWIANGLGCSVMFLCWLLATIMRKDEE